MGRATRRARRSRERLMGQDRKGGNTRFENIDRKDVETRGEERRVGNQGLRRSFADLARRRILRRRVEKLMRYQNSRAQRARRKAAPSCLISLPSILHRTDHRNGWKNSGTGPGYPAFSRSPHTSSRVSIVRFSTLDFSPSTQAGTGVSTTYSPHVSELDRPR